MIDTDGIGASTYHLPRPELRGKVRADAGSAHTNVNDRAGVLAFANVRAATYWQLRDRLDPSRHSLVALPPDRRVLADLTTPRWKKVGEKIALEKKEEIKARLGRSPDWGDPIVMAFWDDPSVWLAEAVGQGMRYQRGQPTMRYPSRRLAGASRRRRIGPVPQRWPDMMHCWMSDTVMPCTATPRRALVSD